VLAAAAGRLVFSIFSFHRPFSILPVRVFPPPDRPCIDFRTLVRNQAKKRGTRSVGWPKVGPAVGVETVRLFSAARPAARKGKKNPARPRGRGAGADGEEDLRRLTVLRAAQAAGSR
jgi:hypothetical protein